jgi:simple sugar transport system ATP-binding protein
VRAGLLSVQDLTLNGPPGSPRPLLSDITFDVAPGEVFGIAGVDGNGQAELAECLAGLLRPSAGSIRVAGKAPMANPAAFRHAGVTVIPADRQRRGLALPLTITENLALGVYDKGEFRRGPILLWPRLRERANGLIRRFDVRTTGPDVPVRSLSGGNQQKVVVARALADAPRVVVAVNPTRGLDVGAIAYVHDSLRRAQAGGAAIVLISTELEEVLTLADRVAVLYEGRFSGIVPPETPREEIGLLMGGQPLRDNAG